MFDRFLHHWDVVKASWKHENQRRKDKSDCADVEFLPAALEIMERPPSPVGRSILWVIIVFLVLAFSWSYVGHVDVVARAPGKLVLLGQDKSIQPVNMGTIRNIFVQDGQSVERGQVLIELDSTLAESDRQQIEAELSATHMLYARAHALSKYNENEEIEFTPPQSANESDIRLYQKLLDSEIDEFESQIESLKQEKVQAEAELALTLEELEKLQETLPLIAERMEARRILTEKGLAPRLLYLELQESHIEAQHNLSMQRDQYDKMVAANSAIERRIDQAKAEFRMQALTELADAEQQIDRLTERLEKAVKLEELQQLVSPVDGVVQQLAVHTVGGVVEPAQTLMVVVPRDGKIVLDAQILNKDIGFVSAGDPVNVKLEAFPFTRYGVIAGTIEYVSTDAIPSKELGLAYSARIRLEDDKISVDGSDVRLSPGMTATAEILTGNRRIIDFLLSPILRYQDESFRER